MELRYLRTLVAIADRGTFVAAGEDLGLTQSAISLHVKNLEDELGARLFDRSRRPPMLNARGRALVEEAREIIARCERLTRSVSDDGLAGRLELGAVPTSLTGVLPVALAALRATHPRLAIRVESGLSAELAGRVGEGELDAAVVSEPVQLATGLSWHPFVREPLMVIAPPGTEGSSDRELIEARPFIRFQRQAWAGRLIDSHLRDRGIGVELSMEVNSLEAIAKLVHSGLGVSVVPLRPGAEPLPPGLRALPFGEPPLARVVGVVERTANPKAALVQALYGELVAASSEGPDT